MAKCKYYIESRDVKIVPRGENGTKTFSSEA
jgi:hypothetical protein